MSNSKYNWPSSGDPSDTPQKERKRRRAKNKRARMARKRNRQLANGKE
jgi:hypothetical protein